MRGQVEKSLVHNTRVASSKARRAWWIAVPSIAVLALLLGAVAWFALSGNGMQTEATADEGGTSPPVPETQPTPNVPEPEKRPEFPVTAQRFQEGPSSSPGAALEEGSGIALFPPLGTKPLKRGLVVPEDYELPPGYVRHYQTTDDGESVPAILLFHPDFQPVDADGKPIPVPKDRVVPPQLAPPGFPLEQLVLPEDNPNERGAARWQRPEER